MLNTPNRAAEPTLLVLLILTVLGEPQVGQWTVKGLGFLILVMGTPPSGWSIYFLLWTCAVMSKGEAGANSLGNSRVGVRGAMSLGVDMAGVHEVEIIDRLWSCPCAAKGRGGAEIFRGTPLQAQHKCVLQKTTANARGWETLSICLDALKLYATIQK